MLIKYMIFPLHMDLFNIFNFDTVVKLVHQGRIDKAYARISRIAEDNATKDTKLFIGQERAKIAEYVAAKGTIPKITAISRAFKYKQKRIDYHTNNMLKLLELRLKGDSK